MSLNLYKAAVLADAPAAYWMMQDASGNPIDSSGNALDFTTTTGTPDYQFAVGPCGNDVCIRLAGGEDFQRARVLTAVDNFALELWVNLQVIGANDQTLGSNQSGGVGYTFNVDIDRTLQFIYQGVAVGPNSATVLPLTTWRHVVLERRAGTTTYYVNGVADANTSAAAPNAPTGASISKVGDGSVQFAVAHVAYYAALPAAARWLFHFEQASAQDFAGSGGGDESAWWWG